MIAVVLSGLALALVAPWLHQIFRGASGWLFALLPLGLTIYLAGQLGPVSDGKTFIAHVAWVPLLNVSFSFYLDGLSLLFALLITGIGTPVVIYSGGYLAGHPQLGRFYAFLLVFMAAMLGVVLADNLLTLFVFWELTSISSYLLIGFDHEREKARGAALQALLVTGGGGLALLVGLLLLGQAGGSFELSSLIHQGQTVRAHALYVPILLLILIGAFTKSAQVPFHFWLPNAMEAPTPVSAYLHAATMVKAGVYLLARLNPVLGNTEIWLALVGTAGAATMLIGAYLALLQADFKRILAYSTVSALGILTFTLGLGTTLAIQAAMVFLFAHALYKGALFLVAGAIDHETGVRDVDRVGGLWRAMPITAAAASLAALSMAGLPPLFGFISKEFLFEAMLDLPLAPIAPLLLGAVVLTGMILFAVAALVSLKPFTGARLLTSKMPHEAPLSLWLGPSLLAGIGLLTGLFPRAVDELLLARSAEAVLGRHEALHLSLWHGLNPMLGLSALTILGGLSGYFGRSLLRRAVSPLARARDWSPSRAYELALIALNRLAYGLTQVLQSGYLRVYLITILATAVGLVGTTLVTQGKLQGLQLEWSDLRFYEVGLALLILLAAGAAVRSSSRLGAVALLGVVGYGISLIYILFGAPDIAMAQVLIETLTVILFVLVFYNLPRYANLSTRPARVRDALVGLTVGGLMTALVLVAVHVQFHPSISDYYVANSLSEAHGRNVVNVIIVDFRALDTLGEITVLALAAVGVYALLKLRLERREDP